jgi:uncharacterized protein (DUF362 family)
MTKSHIPAVPGPAISGKEKTSSPAVAVIPCEDHNNLSGATSQLRQLMPALLPSVLPRHVVIKPNLCDITAWETGVTTDPSWLPVLTAELRSIRSDVEITVVESDAVSAYKTYRSCDETFDRLGYRSVARECGVNLVNLSNAEAIEISFKDVPHAVSVPMLLLEEFFFISIANLKVHPYERMTAILKNSLGLLTNADISVFHPYLSTMISQLHSLCTQDLCIVDGRIGLEGSGPIIGDPVRMDTLIFSNDALAADVTACKLMMVPPGEVPHLRKVAGDLGRSFSGFQMIGDLHPRRFAFDPGRGHRSILLKFANRRFHKASELFTNRLVDRFIRFKREPVAFATQAIPKIARRLTRG